MRRFVPRRDTRFQSWFSGLPGVLACVSRPALSLYCTLFKELLRRAQRSVLTWEGTHTYYALPIFPMYYSPPHHLLLSSTLCFVPSRLHPVRYKPDPPQPRPRRLHRGSHQSLPRCPPPPHLPAFNPSYPPTTSASPSVFSAVLHPLTLPAPGAHPPSLPHLLPALHCTPRHLTLHPPAPRCPPLLTPPYAQIINLFLYLLELLRMLQGGND